MTWITDGSGRRWVEIQPRKRRKSPRALRFANIKVGDQLMQTREVTQTIRDPKAANDQYIEVPYRNGTTWHVVTDVWFDPVRGQDNPVAGQMIGIARIDARGDVMKRKHAYPIRGLASQQFHCADRDYITWCKERLNAIDDGKVVGIGKGAVIRRRPKVAGL